MRNMVLAILTFGLVASFGGAASAADLSPQHSYVRHAHVAKGAGWHRVADWPRMRVVEQVPYCGDCDNLIGRPGSQLHYIGYLPWTRGCALGGCAGPYNDYGCYLREGSVADGRGGWTRGYVQVCD